MKIESRKAAEGIQRRSAELRAATDKFEISARAIKYGAISLPIRGMFIERIAPGAFSDSLKRGDEIVALFNHDENNILGRTRTGALQIDDGPSGMNFTCRLNRAVQAHRDLYELVKDGTISECSFSFECDQQTWDENYPNPDALPLRTVTHGKLYDVSVVTSPAYSGGATMAEARTNLTKTLKEKGLAEAVKILRKAAVIGARSFERALRDGTSGAGDEGALTYASRLQRAHEMGELCCRLFEDVYHRSLEEDPDDDDGEIDALTRGTVAVAKAAADIACENAAASRLYHGRALEAKKKK